MQSHLSDGGKAWCLLERDRAYSHFRNSAPISDALSSASRLQRRSEIAAPPTDVMACVAGHARKRTLPFYLEEVSKLFYSRNLSTQPAVPVNRKINRCTFFFCLHLLRMMDYRTQIAVIIGKPLTFRHYPYTCT